MFEITPVQGDPSKVTIEADVTSLMGMFACVKGSRDEILNNVKQLGFNTTDSERAVNCIYNDYTRIRVKTLEVYKKFIDECSK